MVATKKKIEEAKLMLTVNPAQILKLIKQLSNEEIVKLHNKMQEIIDELKDVNMDEAYGMKPEDKHQKPMLVTLEKIKQWEKEEIENPVEGPELTLEEELAILREDQGR